MRRQWIIAAVIGSGFAAVVAFALLSRGREPVYNGRHLAEWLAAFPAAASRADVEASEAADAIRHIGTNAVPWLLRWTDYRRPLLKQWLPQRALRGLGIKWLNVWLKNDPGAQRAQFAVRGFLVLGPKAGAAVPELKRRAGDWSRADRCFYAARALDNMREMARPTTLVWLLTSTNAFSRQWAESLCGLAITNPASICQWLAEYARNADTHEANQAIRAIERLALERDSGVAALVEAMRDPRWFVQLEAADALGRIGPRAVAAVPALLEVARTNQALQIALRLREDLRRISPEALKKAIDDEVLPPVPSGWH